MKPKAWIKFLNSKDLHNLLFSIFQFFVSFNLVSTSLSESFL